MSAVLATPTVAAENWIIDQLTAAPALAGVGIFIAAATEETPRPKGTSAGPYITLRHLGANDWYYLGGRMGGCVILIEVSAWELGTETTRIKPIIDAAHDAIQAQRGSSDGVAISACVRAAAVERQIIEGNRPYTQLGGEYRIRATTP